MATLISSYNRLSDQSLLREVGRLAACERDATVHLVASLAALDQRHLYLPEGYGSLFGYCTQVLQLSESATYKRIAAARAAQRFPVILERLAAGDVTLTTIRLLAPHLTEANHIALLAEVRHRSTREVEQIVARLQPRPDVPSTVRKLPTPPAVSQTASPPLQSTTPDQPAVAPTPAATRDDVPPSCAPPVSNAAATCHEPVCAPPPDRPHTNVTPLAPARYKVSFTIGAETYGKLREAQHLLRHVIPSGDVGALFDRALTLVLRDAAKTKYAATEQPRVNRPSSLRQAQERPERGRTTAPKTRSRHISAEVKRRVWARDHGECAFVSASGKRCAERGFLEYHHLVPYAAGGDASVENISLRCRRHNVHEAEQVAGPWQPSSVREERPGYGGEGVAPRERPARVHVRHVFAVGEAVCRHASHAATGRAASSWRPPPTAAPLAAVKTG
ncbi:MAG: hypothetical protein GEV06_27265 [Luteitalea sp.]|nr:hypothetical protein [Luteitalea sp.]